MPCNGLNRLLCPRQNLIKYDDDDNDDDIRNSVAEPHYVNLYNAHAVINYNTI